MKQPGIRLGRAAIAWCCLWPIMGIADPSTSSIPIRVTLPLEATRFTVAINDAAGARVRNLAADRLAADAVVGTVESGRVVEVGWDGCDDEGRPVPAGRYQAVGLSHEGLGAAYDLSFYNPGTPPWNTADGSGAWGSGASAPQRAACAGEWMVLAWPDASDGHGLIGIGPDGRKQWGRAIGADFLAGDETNVYALIHGTGDARLIRLNAADGTSRSFFPAGGPETNEWALADIFTNGVPGRVTGMAAYGGVIVLTLDDDVLAWISVDSGRLLRRINVPMPHAPAFGPDGTLYAVIRGVVHRLVLEGGLSYPLMGMSLKSFEDIAVDRNGNLVLAEGDPARMIRLYTPEGRLVRMLGTPGGRPARGPFASGLASGVSAVEVDRENHIWTVEKGSRLRRVSVWTNGGKLIRDYVGNPGGGGAGCYLHDDNPRLAYAGSIEFKLDHPSRSWRVSKTLWEPNTRKGEGFVIDPEATTTGQRWMSDVNGLSHEYLYHHDGPHVIFMPRPDGWRPVSAVGLVGHLSGSIDRDNVVRALPSGEFADCHAHDGFFWNDENDDGIPQRAECVIVPTATPGALDAVDQRGVPALSLDSGSGGRIGRDLSFFTDGVVKYHPVDFTADGAPRYAPAGMQRLPIQAHGDLVPISEENLLIGWSEEGGPESLRVVGIDTRDGTKRWSCPNPAAPAAPLGIMGAALVDESMGRVFALRSRAGQDFFMTTDGLLIGSLFRKAGEDSAPLPASEDELAGLAMEALAGGDGTRTGWFGKQSDGRIRLTVNMARQAAMVVEVKGLEKIQRFAPVWLEVGLPVEGEAAPDTGTAGRAAIE